METPNTEEIKEAWDHWPPSKMLLPAQLSLLAAGIVGGLKLPLVLLVPCILGVMSGEALRLFRQNRPHGLSWQVIPGLLFSSTVFCFILYGAGRGVAWMADYFG